MRKMNYVFGALALGMGVLVGTLGMSLFTNSSSPASFISKLRGEDQIQTVSGEVSGLGKTPSTINTAQGGASENSPVTDSENSSSPANPAGLNALSPEAEEAYKEQIVTDYKQNIGTFFGAWKSADMETFRLELAKAYTGDLFERHAQRAEEYLSQGVGLDVSEITFDRVDVESADMNTATLRVDYRYTARDYNLADATPIGEEHEQTVQARVNLVKQNSHWMITGESTTQ